MYNIVCKPNIYKACRKGNEIKPSKNTHTQQTIRILMEREQKDTTKRVQSKNGCDFPRR